MTATDVRAPQGLDGAHEALTAVLTSLPADTDSLHLAAVRHIVHCAVASIDTLRPERSYPIDVAEVVGIAREALTAATMLAGSTQ